MTLVPADQHQHPGNGYGQVAPYQPHYPQQFQPQPIAPVQQPAPQEMRLTEWANEARAAAALAASLVKTSFVPKAFAGKVEEATAAILTGAEMGLSPMASLRAIYVIHGTPGMYAKTMRAVVQSKGHDIWVHEMTATRVTVKGRRKGSDHVESSTWSMDRAKTAKLTSNDQYTKNPINMLLARATAEVCWLVASDALSGIAASVEELESGDFDESADPAAPVEEPKAARRTAKRKPLDRAEGVEPPLPPAQAVLDRGEPEQPPVDGVTRAQVQRMQILFRDKGIDERDLRLGFVAEKVGRQVATSNDLTAVEAETVIAALVELPDMPRDDEPTGGDR